jgi:TIR domain-containing protein
MNFANIDSVRSFRFVENQFIQVLISRFSLCRHGKGTQLSVKFGDRSPAISTRPAKTRVQQEIPDFETKSLNYQKALDAFLLDGYGESYEHDDEDFPFRYASGGTLPIVRTGGADYYCLFYRDIFPTGWNIANGGCCTREELLYPLRTVERELREELIILNRYKKTRYGFKGGEGPLLFHPHRAGTQKSWLDILPELAQSPFKELEASIKWMNGPDSLKVQIEDYDFGETVGCFLNINAEDFGIEIDNVAKIGLSKDEVICDGEQIGNCIINRLVGLFEVRKLDQLLGSGGREFLPDKMFFNARPYEGLSLESVMDEIVPYLRDVRSVAEMDRFSACASKYDLCPVTRRILKRFASREQEHIHAASQPMVFISYGGDDERVAKKVYDSLKDITKVFFFKEYDYRDTLARAIDEALDSAMCLVVVGSKLENVNRDRCAYEWKRFCQDLEHNLKPNDAVVIPFISHIDPEDLPRELRQYFAVRFRPARLDLDIVEELCPRIPRSIKRSAAAG